MVVVERVARGPRARAIEFRYRLGTAGRFVSIQIDKS